jgi:hypothetical protein
MLLLFLIFSSFSFDDILFYPLIELNVEARSEKQSILFYLNDDSSIFLYFSIEGL